MALLQYDEFDNESLESFWTLTEGGSSVYTEEKSGRGRATTSKGEQIQLKQQSLTDTELDIWFLLEMKNPKDYCDTQIWVSDEVVYQGAIAVGLAYHDVQPAVDTQIVSGTPGEGLWFYGWKDSDTWGSEIVSYARIDQPYVYARIRAIAGRSCHIFYAKQEPTLDGHWIHVPQPLTPEYVPTTLDAIYIAFNGYWNLAGTERDAYIHFVRPWVSSGSAGNQGGSNNLGVNQQGFGGFGFGWG